MMLSSLLDNETKIRVSSVLNRDVKQFGKKYLTDGNVETCWNSDQVSLFNMFHAFYIWRESLF